jgi:DNA-directed RNA polymerase subunit omega
MPETRASLKGIFGGPLKIKSKIGIMSLDFVIAPPHLSGMLRNSILEQMNAELCKKALEKIGSPNVLINMVSRRVRQLTAGGGGLGRPLVDVPASMGMADIALTEIVENKMSYDMPEMAPAVRLIPKKRKKH